MDGEEKIVVSNLQHVIHHNVSMVVLAFHGAVENVALLIIISTVPAPMGTMETNVKP